MDKLRYVSGEFLKSNYKIEFEGRSYYFSSFEAYEDKENIYICVEDGLLVYEKKEKGDYSKCICVDKILKENQPVAFKKYPPFSLLRLELTGCAQKHIQYPLRYTIPVTQNISLFPEKIFFDYDNLIVTVLCTKSSLKNFQVQVVVPFIAIRNIIMPAVFGIPEYKEYADSFFSLPWLSWYILPLRRGEVFKSTSEMLGQIPKFTNSNNI